MATAWLHRDGELTLCHDVHLEFPVFYVPADIVPSFTLAMDNEIPLTKHRMDVYERHGLRGKYPVYRYVRTEDL